MQSKKVQLGKLYEYYDDRIPKNLLEEVMKDSKYFQRFVVPTRHFFVGSKNQYSFYAIFVIENNEEIEMAEEVFTESYKLVE